MPLKVKHYALFVHFSHHLATNLNFAFFFFESIWNLD